MVKEPIFLAGATGATGQIALQLLLDAGYELRVVVRDAARLPLGAKDHPRLTITEGSLLEYSDQHLAGFINGCGAIVSCLGHNLTLGGIFGRPRQLVHQATRRLCQAVMDNRQRSKADRVEPVRFILMNSAGCSNPFAGERLSWKERVVTFLLRNLIPPQKDNELAASFLRTDANSTQWQNHVQWVIVRPDSLYNAVNRSEVTQYRVVGSPERSAIFDPGRTARSQVAHFITQLIRDDSLWATWRGQAPVIYSTTELDE